jgi:hypothetical protein
MSPSEVHRTSLQWLEKQNIILTPLRTRQAFFKAASVEILSGREDLSQALFDVLAKAIKE